MMKTRTTTISAAAVALSMLIWPATALAQASGQTAQENVYQLTFIELAFKAFDVVLSLFVLLMQQFLTGFFGLLIP